MIATQGLDAQRAERCKAGTCAINLSSRAHSEGRPVLTLTPPRSEPGLEAHTSSTCFGAEADRLPNHSCCKRFGDPHRIGCSHGNLDLVLMTIVTIAFDNDG